MAIPERTRKARDFVLISEIVPADPTTNTMIHENTRTTIVLSAVAISESVFLIPHLARIDVAPANIADKTAIIIHMVVGYPLLNPVFPIDTLSSLTELYRKQQPSDIIFSLVCILL